MAKEKPTMKWDPDTKQWVRNEAYNCKIFLDAFDNHVVMDAKITFRRDYAGKIKARCEQLNTNLQFPRDLRVVGTELIADVIEAKQGGFYRYFRGSIRRGTEVLG